MDYEKKYKEALERAKQFSEKPYLEDSKGIVEYIFPELAESEDERIRIWIRKELESKYVVDNIVNNVMADKALAWLEKKGEPTDIPADAVLDSNKDGLIADTIRYKRENQCEQKPWSEEDEKLLELSINNLTELKDRFGEDYGRVGDCINWLKYLKDRYTWKPSDEQMVALNNAILLNEDHYNGAVLSTLREQLKKLREE